MLVAFSGCAADFPCVARLPQPPALPTQVGINLHKPTQEQNYADPNFDSKSKQTTFVERGLFTLLSRGFAT